MSSPPRSIWLIAGLGLLTALPAAAQNTLSLQSGDSVAVSGSGTTGTYQGQHVSNGTSAYSSTNGTTVTVAQNSSFLLGKQGAISASSTIQNYTTYGVYSTGGSVTVTGGTISADAGTTGTGLYASNSNVIITGGTVSGRTGINAQNSTVTVSGGTFTGGAPDGSALVAGNSNVAITGGTFTAGNGSAGSAVQASFGSTIKVSGGSFLTLNGYGLNSFGIIDLFGNFSGYKSGDQINSGTGTISGTLLDGEVINTPYFVYSGSIIEFNVGTAPAPEPSQTIALGVGVSVLAGLCVRGRRRVNAV